MAQSSILRICSALLIFFTSASEAASFFNRGVSDLYIGGKVGRVDAGGEGAEKQAAFGFDAAFKVTKSAQAAFQYLGHQYPRDNTLKLHQFSTGVEMYPFSMSDIRASFGVGLGAYRYTGSATGLDFGANIGLGLDVVLGTFRVGVSSRYHALFDTTQIEDFWNILLRFGIEIDV